ncbi:competence protein ComGF [Paraliobacillus quinghaiensis]|uniref:Competence protein ComGF n=1 Tax=Paraliobacillus quinghaiensis TaxID=470815 RepID=A0A917TP91_9BACI|nr:ComGF family competence protein [Paraliobacillus quinghaiensis]GGM31627.1 competence protein ComGF [Paraliobacillus quinghaiensis]
MLNIKKKKHVYTIIHLNENGFTLVSLLISVAIIGSTLTLIPTIFRLIEYDSHTSEYSIRQFFHFLSDELHKNKYDYVENNTIHLTNESGKRITISYYPEVIRRQVNGVGHEIFVRNIETFHVKELSYGVHVSIITTSGESYAKTFSFY